MAGGITSSVMELAGNMVESEPPSELNFGSSFRVWPELLVILTGALFEPTCQMNTFQALFVTPMNASHFPSGLNTGFIGSLMPHEDLDIWVSVRAEKS